MRFPLLTCKLTQCLCIKHVAVMSQENWELHKMLFIYLANFQCTGKYVNCGGSSPRRLCFNEDYLCNGDNDCGNNWDELNQTCGQFAC